MSNKKDKALIALIHSAAFLLSIVTVTWFWFVFPALRESFGDILLILVMIDMLSTLVYLYIFYKALIEEKNNDG